MGKRWDYSGRNPITGKPYFAHHVEVAQKPRTEGLADPTPSIETLPPIESGGKDVPKDLTHAGHVDTAREEEDERVSSLMESSRVSKSAKEGE